METSFSFTMIWSLYLAIFGQAIPSAFGLFALAQTAKSYDGFRGGRHLYFDTFVEALKSHDGTVKLRQSDWVLES